jgi:hypothetical protein
MLRRSLRAASAIVYSATEAAQPARFNRRQQRRFTLIFNA